MTAEPEAEQEEDGAAQEEWMETTGWKAREQTWMRYWPGVPALRVNQTSEVSRVPQAERSDPAVGTLEAARGVLRGREREEPQKSLEGAAAAGAEMSTE